MDKKKKLWEKIACMQSSDLPYERMGKTCRAVDVEILVHTGKYKKKYRVEICENETITLAEGEKRRCQRKIIAVHEYLDNAVAIANSRAKEAGISVEHMIQALSIAHADAMDFLADDDLENDE